MDAVVRDLREGDACFVFYAGHGQFFDNENYLIPVDAELTEPQHVEDRCVSIGYIMRALRFSDCSLKVLVVDACRNSGFRSFRRSAGGLRPEKAPEGTIISFSTAPRTPALDGEGDNSPYVRQLAKAMQSKAAKVEIVRLFRETGRAVKEESGQVPYLEFDVTMPDYYLHPQATPAPTPRSSFTNTVGMKMRLIPAGEFQMGSHRTAEEVAELFKDYDAKASYFTDEHPRHRVRITKSFYAGVHEVTIGQFRQFVKDSGYKTEAETDGEGGHGWNEDEETFEGRDVKYNWQHTGFPQSDTHPVVNVTWNDAVAFCKWISKQEGVTYRLPTEAEWEYMCRAGTTTEFSTGDRDVDLRGVANIADLAMKRLPNFSSTFAWAPFDDGHQFTAPVGQYAANRFGLYDLHGNVWEWCSDWFDSGYYANSPELDPQGPASGSSRVLRGGSWSNYPHYVRSADRTNLGAPDYRSGRIGFRLVCEPG